MPTTPDPSAVALAKPDTIDHLAGITPGSALDSLRARRPESRAQAQAAFHQLFHPADAGAVTPHERWAVAHFVAGLHRDPAATAFYAAGLAATGPGVSAGAATPTPPALHDAVHAAIAEAAATGPWGRYPEGPLSAEDTPGPTWHCSAAPRAALGKRLAAALEHAHLLVFHPRDADPAALQALAAAGWSADAIVTLSQLVSFLAFQIRLAAGLRTLHHSAPLKGELPSAARSAVRLSPNAQRGNPREEQAARAADAGAQMKSQQPGAPHGLPPEGEVPAEGGGRGRNPSRGAASPRTLTTFTRAQLDWLPWLPPIARDALTPRHHAALVDAARAGSDYFRLLARDPDILEARTRTDWDIFRNPDAGAPRAERELAAAATSRVNGCIYCASVHARLAATYAKRAADVDRLLEEGIGADLGERWNAIVAASAALSATPVAFGAEHVERLRQAGLDDLAIADVIAAAAFFGWANRLMLSLGEAAAQAVAHKPG
jgi:alkylhydroperoxidase domain protein/CMD domain protein